MKGNSIISGFDHSQSGNKKTKLRVLLPLALLLAVAAIACSSDSSDGNVSVVGSDSSGSGDQAPEFSITMFQGQDVVGGQEVSLHSLIGPKPIVLNFWAGLCPPCRAEMPDLQEFNDEFEDRALLVGVDLGKFTGLGSQEDAQKLLEDLGITYPTGFTSNREIIHDYRVIGLPMTIFIGNDGNIFNKWSGSLNAKTLKEKTLEMLAQ